MSNILSFKELTTELHSGNVTCVEVVTSFITKIKERQALNAFLSIYSESAIQKAESVDKKIKLGTAGKLAGMVIGIKDNICYEGHPVSASSKILEGFNSLYNATVVERLIKEDAIIIGRLNCDEFAMGSSNENSAFGNVLNPIQEDKVSGGSSGGAAAAVKAGLCHAALGSDTGGSIRQPASFCGIIGFKPTYGRVSRYGLLAYASSFDQIGPLTNNVHDAALIYEVIAGIDEYDGTLASCDVVPISKTESGKKKRIAVISDCLNNKGLDGEIKLRIDELIRALKELNYDVEIVDFPYLDYMVPTYYVLTTAEASSNLARYDGVHYGYRSKNTKDVNSTYINSRSEGFGEEVKRRIMLGTFVLSAGYYDAYYTKALKVRKLISDKTKDIFTNFDYILTPTTPTTAFGIGENIKDPITMYLQDIFTVQANIVGIPAISLPLGNHSNGMPFGVQIMAPKFKEAELLGFSSELFNSFHKEIIEN